VSQPGATDRDAPDAAVRGESASPAAGGRPLWSLVVPVKRLAVAKTRLAGFAGPHRRALALAFAVDTVAAALACPDVAAVVVVTDEPDAADRLGAAGAVVVSDEPDAGLNPALVHGAAEATRRRPGGGVGALSADLPALRPAELSRALRAAPEDTACFVRDAQGSGTTLLLARRPQRFVPAFGAGSAAAHLRLGAHELDGADAGSGLDSLRRDVDTAEDLRAAREMGLGPATEAVLTRLAVPLEGSREASSDDSEAAG
jgi:2-phospho-L-lactate/phosphoenolpyruvate guanylyltransferase